MLPQQFYSANNWFLLAATLLVVRASYGGRIIKAVHDSYYLEYGYGISTGATACRHE